MTILSDLHFDTIFGNDLATEDYGDLVGLADRTVGVEQPLLVGGHPKAGLCTFEIRVQSPKNALLSDGGATPSV
jgi:hypothetical protein